MMGDGNGWVTLADGTRRWGKHGAAGLFLVAPRAPGGASVLLQLRADWVHHGGVWALPGGARDSHETPADAALREAAEEAGIAAATVRVRATLCTARTPGWSYSTVIAETTSGEPIPTTANAESAALKWVPLEDVGELPLLPAFAAALPQVLAATKHALDLTS